MGQDLSCPCQNNDSNVYFPDDPDEDAASLKTMKMPETPDTNLNTNTSTSSDPFGVPALSSSKSRKWDVVSKQSTNLDSSSASTQVKKEARRVLSMITRTVAFCFSPKISDLNPFGT